MTSYLVCGAGLMAEALVYDLARFGGAKRIVVVDNDADRLERFPTDRIEKQLGDLGEYNFIQPLFQQANIACGAASYKLNLQLSEWAIENRTHFVDLGGNNEVVKAQFSLGDRAKRAEVTIIPDCGLAPGMVSVLVADGVARLDHVSGVRIRVGGLPQRPQPPLDYAIYFSAEGLLNEYREPTIALRQGAITELPSLTEPESLSFPPNFPQLEAFHTSGGVSTLPLTYAGRIDTLDYKTIRYPGHLDKIRFLFDLGLAAEATVDLDGQSISPDHLLRYLLTKNLPQGAPDVVLVYVEVRGRDHQRSVSYYIEDYFNQATGHSAMQRMTAYSAGIVMQMLAEGSIRGRGTLRSELGVDPARFIALLKDREIPIRVSGVS